KGREHLLGSCQNPRAALSGGQDFDTVENFCQTYGCRIELLAWSCGHPSLDRRAWLRQHDFRNHVRVQTDHSLKSFFIRSSGITTRGGIFNSTPPYGANSSRIAFPRSFGCSSGLLSSALRMARASSSMERPWRAARRRSLRLVVSSS